MLDSLRQLRYPPEFRIGPPVSSAEAEKDLQRIAASLQSLVSSPDSGSDREVNNLLAQLATELWRLGQRLESLDKIQPPKELRAILRLFQSAWDTIIQSDIEVHDHANEPYDGGMVVDVLTFQPCPGLTREQIIETTRPTIYRSGRMIQRGQVIVGQPAGQTR